MLPFLFRKKMEVYVPLTEYVLGGDNVSAAFYTGTGDAGVASDMCGLALSWTFFYVGTVSFYHIFGRVRFSNFLDC
jgi:hypothetical protein